MEDAATAEISRSQIWQWIHQDVRTEDCSPIPRDRVEGDPRPGLGIRWSFRPNPLTIGMPENEHLSRR